MEQKTCATCIHYIAHYRKDKVIFRATRCGQCLPRYRLKKAGKPCEYWQLNEKTKEEELQPIFAALRDTAKRINDILDILQAVR